MNNNGLYTIGIDVGGSYIKAVLMNYSERQPEILIKKSEKIRKRNPSVLSEEVINYLLEKQNLQHSDIAYIASTGEGEMVKHKKGHFYSMTTHAKGGQYLNGTAKTVVDMGALYVRAIKTTDNGRVIDYKMTGQCASGSGQFIENISRYLGLAIEEVGDISLQAKNPETPSGICAVLAETDVINMVSRGVSITNIIKGIHLSIANRVVKLISSLKAESPIILTGGMAANKGMVQALNELTIGAALWGGFRYNKLKEKENHILVQN